MLVSQTTTRIVRICAALILILLVGYCIHFIEDSVSDTDQPVIMVSLTSLERFLDYPCEPGTEDYRYAGYIMCERRHSFVASPFKKIQVSPLPRLRKDI